MRLAAAMAVLVTLPILAAEPAPKANPFFTDWKTPFGVPPFADIREEHFLPAIQEGIARQKAEVAVITGSRELPTFANTLVALDQSGQFLERVGSVFSNLVGAETGPKLRP